MGFIAIKHESVFWQQHIHPGICGQTVNQIDVNIVLVKLIGLGMQSLHYENDIP